MIHEVDKIKGLPVGENAPETFTDLVMQYSPDKTDVSLIEELINTTTKDLFHEISHSSGSKSSIVTFSKRNELNRYLTGLCLPVRYDVNIERQAYDLVPVFESLGMLETSANLCRDFSVSDDSTYFQEVLENKKVNFDLEDDNLNRLFVINSIANMFGCYDIADHYHP